MMASKPKPLTVNLKQLQAEIGIITRVVTIDRRRIILLSNGHPTAVIIPMNDYKKLIKTNRKLKDQS